MNEYDIYTINLLLSIIQISTKNRLQKCNHKNLEINLIIMIN